MSTHVFLSKPRAYLSGAVHIFKASWFLIKTPSLWGFILIPIAFMMTCLFLASLLLVFIASPIHEWLLSFGPQLPTDMSSLSWWKKIGWGFYHYGSYALIWIFALVLSYSFAISVAPILSEGISDAVIKKKGLQADYPVPERGTPWYKSIIESLFVSFVYVCCMAVLFFCGLIPIVGFFATLAGFFCTSLFFSKEILDVPLAKYNFSLGQKITVIRNNLWLCLGFGGATFILALVPLYNIFLFPIAVIGATTMWYGKIAPNRDLLDSE